MKIADPSFNKPCNDCKVIFNGCSNIHTCVAKNMGFIQTWFGFNGWKALSTKASIASTIFYRVFFAVGLAMVIIAYSIVSGGEDPSLLYIIAAGTVWFLIFQFLLNLIFVNGSKYSQ